MITKADLQQMFSAMRAEAPWDVDSELLWGYFFTHKDPLRLKATAQQLVSMDYHLVAIRPDEENPFHWLHVERIETHSPDTLHQRNLQFYKLADEFGVTYDGMDVGPLPGDDE
jgi:Regulator of ribonuclease activity B